MKKYVALLLTAALCLALAACGGGREASSPADGSTSDAGSTSEVSSTGSQSQETDQSNGEAEQETAEEEPSGAEAVQVAVGDTISEDFMEMTVAETGIAADIKTSITSGVVTQVTGPEPQEGQQYLYIRGTIKNLATEELPVYDFFVGNFQVGDYNYQVSATDCDIIDASGAPITSIDPLMSGTYTIYTAIPDELAASGSPITFTFGFYDMFANEELARNMAFEDDPIALCPYQYTMTLQ